MPVDRRQPAGQRRGEHQRNVADRRTDPKLTGTVGSGEMVCDQSGRQRDHHPGSHPEHAVDKNQQHDVLCEQAEKTADAEQRESRVKNQQLVPAHRQLTGQQDERNDQQRR